MRDHELDLIAALVEGRLEDESEVRALIASSPEYREEYEAQKLAFEALRDVGTASLSETERAALHRDVWTELRSDSAPATKRTPWYYRWVPVAAGLFVVVGLVGVVTQMGGGDDSGEPANLVADLPEQATTSTAAATAETEADAADEQAAPTGGAQTETTAAADGGAEAGDGSDADTSAELFSEEADNARARDFSGANLQAYEDTARTGAVDGCLEQLGIADYEVVATLLPPASGDTSTTSPDSVSLLVAIRDDVESGSVSVAFVDTDPCELVYLDE